MSTKSYLPTCAENQFEEIMQDICFVVFSDDFGVHPSSCQHLFRHVPKDTPVLWVNTIGMRNPKLTMRDLQKAVSKSRRMILGLFKRSQDVTREEEFHILQPLQLPFLKIPLIRKINRFLVCSSVRRHLLGLKIESSILVTTVPNACDYVGCLGERRVVYYCVDDFSEWPGLEKDMVRTMEDELIRKADIFIATSEDLYSRLSGHGREVHLLTHGVDYDFFKTAPGMEHPTLKGIPRPRVGYFGLFDDRSDKGLLLDLAGRMPDISFVITGNVETETLAMRKMKNIYFTGGIPYKELPSMAKGWDVCILPYKVNRLTDAIQPLKLKEYLATGKSVISTPIKEARNMEDYIIIADTADAWESAIRMSIKGTGSQRERDKVESYLQKESWPYKAKQFFSLCTGIKSAI